MVGDLPHLFAHEVISRHAYTAVRIPIVVGVLRASRAHSSDLDVTPLAEATVLKEVLVLSAFRSHEGRAALISGVINFIDLALTAGTVDKVVSESTDAFLILG